MRRDELTKIQCQNSKGVVKMLMPSVVKHEAKKKDGFRPMSAKSIPAKKVDPIIEDEFSDDIVEEIVVKEKKKPGRKAKTN